jgi:hypothetical protein
MPTFCCISTGEFDTSISGNANLQKEKAQVLLPFSVVNHRCPGSEIQTQCVPIAALTVKFVGWSFAPGFCTRPKASILKGLLRAQGVHLRNCRQVFNAREMKQGQNLLLSKPRNDLIAVAMFCRAHPAFLKASDGGIPAVLLIAGYVVLLGGTYHYR